MIEPRKASWACSRLADELPGFADGSLPTSRVGVVEAHVASCEDCAREVQDLRRVRSLLTSGVVSASLPAGLSSRLASIAGESRDEPLWLQAGDGELPSRRRARVRRLKQTAVLGGTVVLVLLTLAMLAAPELRPVTDPARTARADFSAAVAAVGMNEAVAAVLLAEDRGAELTRQSSASGMAVPAASVEAVSSGEVAAWLAAARRTAGIVSGIQRVVVADEGHFVVARVRVVEDPSSGVTMTVMDEGGKAFMSGFVGADQMWGGDLLVPAYDYFATPAGSQTVAGHAVRVIEARYGGEVVARWWLCADDGMLLWTERYGSDGNIELSAGYEKVDASTASVPETVPQLAVLPAAREPAGDWCKVWIHCPTRLAGLPLVAYSTSGTADARVMHLVYSDGVTTASVVRSTGLLAPDGVPVNQYSRRGMPRVQAWQSGTGVVVVATNGSAAVLAAIRSELPSEPPVNPDLAWRIRAGLARLVGLGDH